MAKDNSKYVTDTIKIENAKIIFRNFSGKELTYNPAGTRNFSVLIDDELAEVLERDGWNVKKLRPRKDEEEGPLQSFLQVTVGYKIKPPKIVTISSAGSTFLDEETVHVLDWAEFVNVDIIIRPYNWELRDGRKGVKAYLGTMYITLEENELEKKYHDLLTSPVSEDDGIEES